MSETIQYFLEFLDESGTKWVLDAALRALGEVRIKVNFLDQNRSIKTR